MNLVNHETNQFIQESQRKLILRINDFLPKLQAFMDDVVYHEVSLEECQEIRVEIHKFAGTGTTFGLPELSEKASKLESYLDRIIDDNDEKIEIEAIYDLSSSFLKLAFKLISENLISRRVPAHKEKTNHNINKATITNSQEIGSSVQNIYHLNHSDNYSHILNSH